MFCLFRTVQCTLSRCCITSNIVMMQSATVIKYQYSSSSQYHAFLALCLTLNLLVPALVSLTGFITSASRSLRWHGAVPSPSPLTLSSPSPSKGTIETKQNNKKRRMRKYERSLFPVKAQRSVGFFLVHCRLYPSYSNQQNRPQLRWNTNEQGCRWDQSRLSYRNTLSMKKSLPPPLLIGTVLQLHKDTSPAKINLSMLGI